MIAVWTLFKSTDVIPAAGKYRCTVCKVVIEISEHIAQMNKPFFACPICHAGSEWGPKWVMDDVWEYLG